LSRFLGKRETLGLDVNLCAVELVGVLSRQLPVLLQVVGARYFLDFAHDRDLVVYFDVVLCRGQCLVGVVIQVHRQRALCGRPDPENTVALRRYALHIHARQFGLAIDVRPSIRRADDGIDVTNRIGAPFARRARRDRSIRSFFRTFALTCTNR